MPENDPRWLAAVHEAGHAVAHYLLDVELVEVSIVPNEEDGSGGHTAGSPPPEGYEEALDEANYDSTYGRSINPQLRDLVEKDIMTTLAGGLTAMHVLGLQEHEVGNGLVQLTPEHIQMFKEKHGGEWDKILVGGDEQYALHLAIRVSGSEDEGGAYIEWLRARTLNLIRTPGYLSAVDELARELLERRL